MRGGEEEEGITLLDVMMEAYFAGNQEYNKFINKCK